MEKRRVAVFDIDGTVFRASLSHELMKRLIQDKVISKDTGAQYERQYLKWRDREGTYEDFIHAFIEATQMYWKGVHYGDFADASKIVIGEQSKHTYVYTREMIKNLKARGYYLLAISHSPKTIVDLFCKHMGFDKAYGTVYAIGSQDRLNGEISDPHLIFNKANILKRAIEKENLTLAHSVGVGDSESDISFLEMVARPICFNPNALLYRHARRMKWKVVVERKDVVYEL
jgi:HAD superfamily phosphoserine phosphatase-like hydrolase